VTVRVGGVVELSCRALSNEHSAVVDSQNRPLAMS
jgi:hypothetical protein